MVARKENGEESPRMGDGDTRCGVRVPTLDAAAPRDNRSVARSISPVRG